MYLVLERTFRTVAEMVRECVEGQGLNYKADSEQLRWVDKLVG